VNEAPVQSDPLRATPLAVAAAVVWREGRLLMTQRPPGGPLGLLWELPGGKIEPGETPEHAVVREIDEELGVRARALEVVASERHVYPHGQEVEITFVRCALDGDELRPGRGVHAVAWWMPAEIDLDAVLAADRPFLRRLGAGT
jgi:8-oxo-dGTP diphosphatase